MPLNKTIVSNPSDGMFQTQTETFNEIITDVSSDYRLVSTVITKENGSQISSVSEYILADEAPEASATTYTVGANEDAENLTKTITVSSLAPNTIRQQEKQRLENGVVVSSHTNLI